MHTQTYPHKHTYPPTPNNYLYTDTYTYFLIYTSTLKTFSTLQWYKGKSVKKGFFSGFREYFLIGVSYVPDFFIAVKNYVGRTF